MKIGHLSARDKLVASTLVSYISHIHYSQDAQDLLELFARENGAKKPDEVIAAGICVKDVLNLLAIVVDEQGLDKVIQTLKPLMKDE